MRSTRKLELRRERLTELTTEELGAIAGADDATISRFIEPCDTHTLLTCTIISVRVCL